ncbi:MAG TPA: glycosyltransferase, partial [Candidatus Kapabacteria bacterium]|nr:glycosyltransferase [Candidatus Kapabacteria bacterium]
MELYVCTLAATLAQSGWKPIVLCVPGSKSEQFLREHSVETYPSTGEGYFNVHDILLAQQIIRKRCVSVVHSHTRFDIWTASWAVRGFPKVKLFHSVYMNVAAKKDFLHTWIYKRADGIFSSSEIINKEIRERYPVDPSRVHLLRYGIDLGNFTKNDSVREETRRTLGVAENDILVGILGRIDVQKGVREFAESYLLLPKEKRDGIKYLIIGEPTILRTKEDGSQEYEPDSKACDAYITSFIHENHLEKNIIR